MNWEYIKIELLKRLSSFGWRVGMMLLALLVDFAVENVAGFGLSNEIVIILGLVLGEVSKQINNKLRGL